VLRGDETAAYLLAHLLDVAFAFETGAYDPHEELDLLPARSRTCSASSAADAATCRSPSCSPRRGR